MIFHPSDFDFFYLHSICQYTWQRCIRRSSSSPDSLQDSHFNGGVHSGKSARSSADAWCSQQVRSKWKCVTVGTPCALQGAGSVEGRIGDAGPFFFLILDMKELFLPSDSLPADAAVLGNSSRLIGQHRYLMIGGGGVVTHGNQPFHKVRFRRA